MIESTSVQAPSRFDELEAKIATLPPLQAEPVHYFSKGLYARELTIPAGAVLTGKIHRTEHICTISKGDITIYDEAFGEKRIKAPFTFVSKPGARRAGYAHEETVWTCYHVTEETDLAKLEAQLIEPHHNPLIPNGETKCLGSQ